MSSAADSRYLYVFLDEAGNFDFSANGTRFLIFSTITSARPFDWEEPLMSLKFDLIEHGYEPEYFHASEDPQAVRDEVFKIISEHLPYLCLDSIIVEKRKTGPTLQPIERFYPRMVGYLLRYVIDSAKSAYYDEAIVITDRIPHKKKRKAVEKAIKLILAEMLPAGTSYRILHHASKSSLGLQVADYCNWAVFRKWERDDERSYVLVRSAINSEFDIFSSGKRYYY